MGTLFSALDIARSGLQVAQAQIDVTAHNIANVNTDGYSRQRAEISARSPVVFSYGEIGRGVQMDRVARIRDQFLDSVYRQQSPNLAGADIQTQYYNRIEDLFLEPGETGFGTRLNDFFDVLNTYANNVESLPARESVVAEAQGLSASLSEMAQRLDKLRTDANQHISDLVPEINSLAESIAGLNDRIRTGEASGGSANDLRDQRDVLLDKLSGYVNITTNERTDGQVEVLVGDKQLISGIEFRALAAVRNPGLDAERSDLVEVRFVDNNELLGASSGQLASLSQVRDTIVPEVDNRLDTLASTVIRQINLIHSQGNGLQALTGQISSSNAVTGAATPLLAAGLPFPVAAGSFDVVVYDSGGVATSTSVTVGTTTTLNDLAAQLASIPHFSASVSGGNTLRLGATAGYTFSFANDTSGALAALGINGLFTGHDARSIGVNADIAANPALLASSFNTDTRNTGDNTAALALADVRNGLYLDGNNASINDYYEATVARIGIESRSAQQVREVEDSFIQDFQKRRQEISGVSLDEEVTYMIQFERAFEASARIISVVDRMMETLINSVG